MLRLKEGLGVGFLTGGFGKWNKQIDFYNNKNLKEDIQSRERARADIARSIVGLTYAGLFTAIGFPLFGGGDDDEEKEVEKTSR